MAITVFMVLVLVWCQNALGQQSLPPRPVSDSAQVTADGADSEASHRQVKIEVRVAEVAQSQLAKLSPDFGGAKGDVSKGAPAPCCFSILKDIESFRAAWDALRKDGLVRILAEPVLVTESGRIASFRSGEEVLVSTGGGVGLPPRTRPYLIGTEVDLLSQLTGTSQVRLEVRVGASERADTVGSTSGLSQFPKLRNFRLHTVVEMESGQTCVLRGGSRQVGKAGGGEPSEAVEAIVVVTATVLE